MFVVLAFYRDFESETNVNIHYTIFAVFQFLD